MSERSFDDEQLPPPRVGSEALKAKTLLLFGGGGAGTAVLAGVDSSRRRALTDEASPSAPHKPRTRITPEKRSATAGVTASPCGSAPRRATATPHETRLGSSATTASSFFIDSARGLEAVPSSRGTSTIREDDAGSRLLPLAAEFVIGRGGGIGEEDRTASVIVGVDIKTEETPALP